MKRIEAYLKPFRLAEVRDALARAKFDVVHVHAAEELRAADAYSETVQGMEYEVDVTPRSMLVLFVDDEQVQRAVSVILSVASTDNSLDGRIVISTVEVVVPVDPNDKGEVQVGERQGEAPA